MALPEGFAKNLKKYQAHNDLPIFLKGGPIDKVLFGITVGLCGIGVLGFMSLVYDLGFKKKQG